MLFYESRVCVFGVKCFQEASLERFPNDVRDFKDKGVDNQHEDNPLIIQDFIFTFFPFFIAKLALQENELMYAGLYLENRP